MDKLSADQKAYGAYTLTQRHRSYYDINRRDFLRGSRCGWCRQRALVSARCTTAMTK